MCRIFVGFIEQYRVFIDEKFLLPDPHGGRDIRQVRPGEVFAALQLCASQQQTPDKLQQFREGDGPVDLQRSYAEIEEELFEFPHGITFGQDLDILDKKRFSLQVDMHRTLRIGNPHQVPPELSGGFIKNSMAGRVIGADFENTVQGFQELNQYFLTKLRGYRLYDLPQ